MCIDSDVPPVVRASGELDYVTCPTFESVLQQALETGGDTIVLDLDELSFVDSCGVRLLIRSALEAGKAGQTIRIASMTAHLDRVLTLTGFKDLFGGSLAVGAPGAVTQTGTVEDRCFQVPAIPDACRTVRNEVADYAARMGFSSLAVDDIKLAVGEAVSNAVRHGCTCDDCIEVACRNDDATLSVSFSYPGTVFDPNAVPAPTYDTAPEGGMGIYFMKLVMDEVGYGFQDGLTVLTIKKKLT